MDTRMLHRRTWTRLGVSVAVAVLLVGSVTLARVERATAALGVDHQDVAVILYGDSLAWEAETEFTRALRDAGISKVWTRTYGGTAICDWFDEMQSDADAIHPSVVVVEFSGNALTPCMTDERGSSLALDREAHHAKYREDARRVLELFGPSGAHVIFAGAPISLRGEETHDPASRWFNQLYASLPIWFADASYVDAGASVLRNGRWTATLACLAAEPCVGGTDADDIAVNVVRAPDGGHFCPGAPGADRGVTTACSVWSSGAYRYAHAMAGSVLAWLASEPRTSREQETPPFT
jgi:hypothetical protein